MLSIPGTVNAQDCSGISLSVVWGCNDPTSGWASLDEVAGATPPLTILWSTGANTQFLPDISNGEHWVQVTDGEGCVVQEEFTVGCLISPDCVLDINIEHGCFDTTSAWASVETTGATAPTTILWSTGHDTQYISGIPTGEHWVMVSEAADCWVKESFSIDCAMDPDCPLEVTIEQGCDAGGGHAAISALAGAGEDTQIYWSTGDTTMSVSGLTNGTYYVVVMNSETCWRKEHFTIECPDDGCLLDISVDHGCYDTTSAWATVNMSGAVSPTEILWSNGATVQYVEGLPNGEHWVMVTDADGCQVQEYFTVACSMDPDCELEVGLEHGCDADGGWASISGIIGGTDTTVIYWSTGDESMSVGGISNGLHYLVVMNSETCWRKEHFTIECDMDPDCELDATVEWGCLDTLNAWGNVQIAGATAATSILWSNGDDVQFVDDLPPGEQWVMVTRSEDCWDIEYFTVDCAMDPGCALEVDLAHGCDGSGGWASIEELTGATEATVIYWSNGDTTMSVSGLSEGTHYVVVMDTETCWRKEHFTVECGGGTGDLGFDLYPMPVQDVLNVELRADEAGPIAIQLVDLAGRIVLDHGTVPMTAGGTRTITIPVAALNNGSYMLTLRRGDRSLNSARVIISR